MLVKYAFFAGSVKPGHEDAMKDYVIQTLEPLWREFQPSEAVRVLYNIEQDSNGPPIPLALAVSYRDEQALALAMQTPARFAARDLLPEFYRRFFDDVKLLHYVFEH